MGEIVGARPSSLSPMPLRQRATAISMTLIVLPQYSVLGLDPLLNWRPVGRSRFPWWLWLAPTRLPLENIKKPSRVSPFGACDCLGDPADILTWLSDLTCLCQQKLLRQTLALQTSPKGCGCSCYIQPGGLPLPPMATATTRTSKTCTA